MDRSKESYHSDNTVYQVGISFSKPHRQKPINREAIEAERAACLRLVSGIKALLLVADERVLKAAREQLVEAELTLTPRGDGYDPYEMARERWG